MDDHSKEIAGLVFFAALAIAILLALAGNSPAPSCNEYDTRMCYENVNQDPPWDTTPP